MNFNRQKNSLSSSIFGMPIPWLQSPRYGHQPTFIAILVALFLCITSPTLYAQSPTNKSGVAPQVISLPSGPGSIEGIGESFEPDLSTGTARYSVNFAVAPGRNGFAPALTLNYNGGHANGPWGLGWRLNVPHIQRQTDEGLPAYDDAKDRFIYSNGEKLVALANGDYRFANEGEFLRFRRLDNGGWEAHRPDGVRYVFGAEEQAREQNQYGIFRWRLESQIDTNGNAIDYLYTRDVEQGSNVAYLSEIRYNPSSDGRTNAVVFQYEPRADIFTDRTSRAPMTTAWRVAQMQVVALAQLTRAYRFDYVRERSTDTHSLLAQVTQIGNDGASELPPTTFTYTAFDDAAHDVVSMQNPPPVSLRNADAELVDINYDGLPDVVYTPLQGHRFHINRGAERLQPDAEFPAHSPGDRLSQAETQMVDVTGNGQVDLVVRAAGGGARAATGAFYYYARQPGQLWEPDDRIILGSNPNFALDDPNLRWLDVNHDKRIDVMLTTHNRYFIWLAQANDSWSAEADFVVPPVAVGTPLRFADPHVKLGDMTGDRLQELVFVRDGLLVYFPHNGNGDFDVGVTMQNVPRGLGDLAQQIQLDDINNDGLDDLILAGNHSLRYWLNRGDGSFTDARQITGTPGYNPLDTALRLADVDGDGRCEMLYSRYPAPADETLQYVDFSTGPQPNLLATVDNGLGRTIIITYKASTVDYVAAWDNDDRWDKTLPFAVQVVSRVQVQDANSGDTYITDYVYRDGHYDGEQKEFRGFGQVDTVAVGDETAATTITRHIYDLGLTDESRKGMVLEMAVLGEGGSCEGEIYECYRRAVNQLATRVLHAGSSGEEVAHSFVSQTNTYIHENEQVPIQLRQAFMLDEFGNRTADLNYGQVCDDDVTCGNDELLQYTEYAHNLDTWLVNRPAVVRQTDAAENLVSETRFYYDGADYLGLPLHEIEQGNLTRQTQWLGNQDNRYIPTRRQAFDSHGNVVGILDANDNLTSVDYDPLQHTFPVAEHIHLSDGQKLTSIATYNMGLGQVAAAANFNGHVTHFSYDAFGRLQKIAKPGDTLAHPTQQFTYNLSSPRSSILTESREQSGEDALLRTITYVDGLGRTLQTRRAAEDGRFIVDNAVIFNARQSAYQSFLPYFDASFAYAPPDRSLPHTATHYDPLGRVVRTVNPDGSFATVSHRPLTDVLYDEEDNTADSPHFDTPTTRRYDGLERITQVAEVNIVNGQQETYATTYGYDMLGNLTRITDVQGNVTTSTYDALSRRLRLDNPDQGIQHYHYDDAGNLVQRVDAKGQTITYRYDPANRLRQELWTLADGTQVPYATYHYDHDRSPRQPDAQNTLGQITYIEDQAGTIAYSYDARGNTVGTVRTFAEENLAFVTRMTHDAMDRVTSVTYPDGLTVDFTHNAQGLLDAVPGFVENIDYTASDQRAQITYGNGVHSDYAYDSRLRLSHLHSTNDRQTVLQDLHYDFDNASNMIAIRDGRAARTTQNDLTQRYIYDDLYRLIGANGTYGSIDYVYDSIHNLVRKSSSADPRLNLGDMRYGENGAGPHALTTVGDETYRYDANGNRLSNGTATYAWDHRNQLTSVDENDTTSSYVYDAGGQRVRQTVVATGSVTTTLYLGQYAEVRSTPNGDQLVQYIFANDGRVAQVTSTFDPARLIQGFTGDVAYDPGPLDAAWYLSDHLGGTSLLLDESGQVEAESTYYPYGLTRYAMNGKEVRYRFTGKELDETGLYYYGARYYDPYASTWLSTDPILGQYLPTVRSNEGLPGLGGVFNTTNLNLYHYAGQNPVKYVDPNGQFLCAGACIAAGIAIAGAGMTAYDAYQAYQEGGIGSAAKSVGIDMVINAATGGVGKLASKLMPSSVKAKAWDAVKSVFKRGCSFSGDTVVTTVGGPVAIEDIQAGDLALAYHEALGTSGYYTVTTAVVHLDPVVVVLTLDDEQIETTPEHPFFTLTNEWITAGDLKVGNRIRRADGSYGMVQSLNWIQQLQLMYDLTVADAHTFYVGQARWLVHNCGGLIAGTKGLEHSFSEHAHQWWGIVKPQGKAESRFVANYKSQWQELVERAAKSKNVVDWRTGADATQLHLAFIDGKHFAVQFFKEGDRAGELATAFIPNPGQLRAINELLGK